MRYTALGIIGTVATLAVPAATAGAITRLELDRGRSRSRGALTGAMYGAGAGLVVGLATQSMADTDCHHATTTATCDDISRGEYVVVSTIGGAFWGGVIGAIVGRERWEPIRLAATPGRIGVAVTFR